jgi:hypothetical protein
VKMKAACASETPETLSISALTATKNKEHIIHSVRCTRISSDVSVMLVAYSPAG